MADSKHGLHYGMGLPKADNKEVIMVILEKKTKSGYFIPLDHPYKATEVHFSYLKYTHGFVLEFSLI